MSSKERDIIPVPKAKNKKLAQKIKNYMEQERIRDEKRAKQIKHVEEPFQDDYSDDTDDEQVLSRIGKIPQKWYDDFKHIGYDLEAKQVIKKQQDDKIDEFISKSENVNWWRSIKDVLNQEDIVLTNQQLQLLDRIRAGKYADKTISETDYSFEYEWKEGMFPLSAAPKPKRSFLPSKHERIKVNKLMHLIQTGKISLKKPEKKQEEEMFDIWESTMEDLKMPRKMPPPITAPKMALPGHNESYNPSEEYILDEQEQKGNLFF